MNRRLLLLAAILAASVAATLAACDVSVLGGDVDDRDASVADATRLDSSLLKDTGTDAADVTDTQPPTPDVGVDAAADSGADAALDSSVDVGIDATPPTVCDIAGHGADGKVYNGKCYWIAAALGKGSDSATTCGVNAVPAMFAKDPKDIAALDWPNFGAKCNKIVNAGYCWVGDSTGTNNCKNGPLSVASSACCEITFDGKVAHGTNDIDVAKCGAPDQFYAICQSK